MSNLTSLQAVVTKATKAKKNKHSERVRRKQRRQKAAGKKVKCYYIRLPTGGFQGGPDLATSAIYPQRFITAVYKCWLGRHTLWV